MLNFCSLRVGVWPVSQPALSLIAFRPIIPSRRTRPQVAARFVWLVAGIYCSGTSSLLCEPQALSALDDSDMLPLA
jgi:hypothetical protein